MLQQIHFFNIVVLTHTLLFFQVLNNVKYSRCRCCSLQKMLHKEQQFASEDVEPNCVPNMLVIKKMCIFTLSSIPEEISNNSLLQEAHGVD